MFSLITVSKFAVVKAVIRRQRLQHSENKTVSIYPTTIIHLCRRRSCSRYGRKYKNKLQLIKINKPIRKVFFLFQCTCNETFKERFKLFEGGTFQTINSTTKLKLYIVLYVKLSFMFNLTSQFVKPVMSWFFYCNLFVQVGIRAFEVSLKTRFNYFFLQAIGSKEP